MTKDYTCAEILKIIDRMPISEQVKLRERIIDKPVTPSVMDGYVKEFRFENGYVCPICGCKDNIVKNGHQRNGKQKYVCKDCGKNFISTTNTIENYSRKNITIWRKYIHCMTIKLSIRDTAKVCGIHYNTAFRWRHIILEALTEMAEDVHLEGIVECDETFFRLSFKGNHNHEKNAVNYTKVGDNYKDMPMPRPPKKRGTEDKKTEEENEKEDIPFEEKKYDRVYTGSLPLSITGKYEFFDYIIKGNKAPQRNNENPWYFVKQRRKRGLSDQQCCVPCGIARNGKAFSELAKLGKVNIDALNVVLGDNRVEKNSVICTDKEKAYIKFSKTWELSLQRFNTKAESRKGLYNIQKVNNYHSHLQSFIIGKLKGVSTKYLNHYLVWHNLLQYDKTYFPQKQDDFFNFVMTIPIEHITAEKYNKCNPIPVLVGKEVGVYDFYTKPA